MRGVHVLIGVLFVAAVIAFGVWVFSGVLKIRNSGSGQQSAESWYDRFGDRKRRRSRK